MFEELLIRLNKKFGVPAIIANQCGGFNSRIAFVRVETSFTVCSTIVDKKGKVLKRLFQVDKGIAVISIDM